MNCPGWVIGSNGNILPCSIDDKTGKAACLLGIAHACECETCSPEAWRAADRESLAADVERARRLMLA